jgi:hypothetical protein
VSEIAQERRVGERSVEDIIMGAQADAVEDP